MFSFLQSEADYKPFTVCAKTKVETKKKKKKGKRIAAAPLRCSLWKKKEKERERQPEAKQRVKIGLKFIRRAQKERFPASGSLLEKRQRLANKFAEAISSGLCRRRHLVW